MKKYIYFLFLIFSHVVTPTFGQDINIAEMTPEDYMGMKLPTLSELYEAAKNCGAVKYYNTRKLEELSNLKSEKRNWLQYIRVFTSYQYGILGMTSTLSSTNSDDFINQSSGRAQNWYNAGASISIPLDDIFDRRNRIKRQRYRVEQTEYEIEKWHDEQKLKIAEAYSNALEALSSLKMKAEAATIATGQYKVSEQDFLNGRIDAAQLSRQKNIESSTVAEYEKTRAALNKAILQLEILANVQIIK